MLTLKNLKNLKKIEIGYDDKDGDYNHYCIIPSKQDNYDIMFHGKHDIEGHPHANEVFTRERFENFLDNVMEKNYVNIVIYVREKFIK